MAFTGRRLNVLDVSERGTVTDLEWFAYGAFSTRLERESTVFL